MILITPYWPTNLGIQYSVPFQGAFQDHDHQILHVLNLNAWRPNHRNFNFSLVTQYQIIISYWLSTQSLYDRCWSSFQDGTSRTVFSTRSLSSSDTTILSFSMTDLTLTPETIIGHFATFVVILVSSVNRFLTTTYILNSTSGIDNHPELLFGTCSSY